jgi:hypothetical protein
MSLAPNAGLQAPPMAAATEERRLLAVACRPMLGREWQEESARVRPVFRPHVSPCSCLTALRNSPLPAAAQPVPAGLRPIEAQGYPCRGRAPGRYGMSPLA